MIGMDVNGPTAVVKSVNSGGRRNAQGGYLLNQRFDPHIVRGEKGVDILEAVLRAHFGSEGEHIQLNVVDNETLRDAQAHPGELQEPAGTGGRIFGFLCGSGGKHTGKYHRADHTEGRLNPQPSAACPCRKRRMRERQAPGQQHRRKRPAALPGKEHPDRTGEKERKMLFENKKVLITGPARGIGRQTAIEMAKEGAVILGLGRTAGPLEEMAGAVGAAGGKAYIRTADIASYEQTDEAVCSLAEAAGGIDIAVNCAAIFEEALFTEMTPQQWRRTVSIDLDGVYNVLHAAMPFIIDAGGSVVNVVSQTPFMAVPVTATTAHARRLWWG